MPDSKGELKGYTERYKAETGEEALYFSYATQSDRRSDAFGNWLESALSTAEATQKETEQKLKDALHDADMLGGLSDDLRNLLRTAEATQKETEQKLKDALHDADMLGGLSDDLRNLLRTAEQRIEELEKERSEVEAHNPINHLGVESFSERVKWTFSMHASEIRRLTDSLSKAEATIAELRAEREKELREAINFAESHAWEGYGVKPDSEVIDDILAAFLAQREGE